MNMLADILKKRKKKVAIEDQPDKPSGVKIVDPHKSLKRALMGPKFNI